MSFDPVRRTKVSDQVADSIRDAIVQGDYSPGDPLPAERELAGQFGVNRSSIREALHRLEAWGLVEIRHGAGARVADFLTTAGLHLLPFLLAPGGQIDPKLLGDVFDLRVELLGWTGAQAASNADESSIEALSAILDDLDATEVFNEVQELDYDFFEQMVAMTDNKVLGLLANVIRSVYLENRELFGVLYAQGVDTTCHHRAIEAIRKGDSVEARQAMSEYGRSALGAQS